MWDNHRMQMFKDLEERFLRYTGYDTMSAPELCGMRRPTTAGQEELLEHLAAELRGMGLDVGYGSEKVVMGTLKGDPSLSPVAFMAHVDTADDVPGNGVKARVWRDYDGSDIVLDGVTIDPSSDPDLLDYIGSEIITSSGDTLLGSDDKAGIAIILSVLERIVSEDIPHPTIEVFFTPDEETGSGMDAFPYERMVSKRCYTIDGAREGDVETECFNAASISIRIEGSVVHPGSGRGRIHNAVTAACHIVTALPASESPEATDGRYGYYGVDSVSGDAGEAAVSLFLRDFDFQELERRIEAVKAAVRSAELLYRVRASVSVDMQYRNMKEANVLHPESHEAIYRAAERIGLTLNERIIRGGTDGAWLAERGIPSPNIFTGGHNLHSCREWVAVEAMGRAADLVLAIVEEGVTG